MSRTERLAWEAGYTTRGERLARETGFTTTRARLISTLFVVGVLVLLVGWTPFHLSKTAPAPSTPTAVEPSDDQARTFGSALSLQQAEAAARAAKQDDPPISSF